MLRSTPLPPCLASERKPAVGILGCSAPELPELAGISLRKDYRRVLASARGFPRLPEKKRHAVAGKASFRAFPLLFPKCYLRPEVVILFVQDVKISLPLRSVDAE